jgi:Fe-S-cluster-containing dehydrogenase component
MHTEMHLMMKCDMCYDRTSVGKKPMCATVCPSQALYFGTREEIEKLRPNSRPFNTFKFGRQTITTKVNLMIPKTAAVEHIDVLSAMHQPPIGTGVEDALLMNLDLPANV